MGRSTSRKSKSELTLAKIQNDLKTLRNLNGKIPRFYGTADPIEAAHQNINPCVCGNQQVTCIYDFPLLPSQLPGANNGTRPKKTKSYFVVCPRCGRAGRALRKPWLAILDWNKSKLSEKPDYTTIPFFFLEHLSPQEAKEQLILIRTDLELRIKEAKLRRQLGRTNTNKKYIEKLKAYLAWCIYAQSLIKVTLKTGTCRKSTAAFPKSHSFSS